MKSVIATLAFIGAAFAQLQINTPASLTECVPVQITYSGGVPPYFVSVIPGGQSTAAPLLQFTETSAATITWIVNITSGTSVTLKVVDSDGADAFSAPDTIEPGTSTSCLTGSTGSSSVSVSASSSSSSASSSGTTTTTTSVVATSTSTTTASATSTTTTTAPHTTTTGTTSHSSAPSTTSSTTSPSGSNVGGSKSGAGMVAAPLALVLGLFTLLA